MSVRLEGFKVRGFGPFDHEFAVDLSELSPTDRVIAICGENGAGKTTALELALPGAMFRQTPTRGSLVDLATARDAFLEARIINGQPWTLRHMVDKVSGKSEALVLDVNGAAVLPDSKVRSFDAWAAKHMPAPEVFFASVFAPQGAGGFLGAKPTERKEILLRILGPEVQRLEADAAFAREALKGAKASLETVSARIGDELERGGDVATLEDVLVWSRKDVERATENLAAMRRVLADEEQAERDRATAAEMARAIETERLVLAGDLKLARENLAALEERAANNRKVLADATAIRAAASRLPELQEQVAAAAASASNANTEAEHLRAATAAASLRASVADRRIKQAQDRLRAAAAVGAAAKRLPDLRKILTAADADLEIEEEYLERLRARRVSSAEDRIAELRGGLQSIADEAVIDSRSTASAALVHDDEQVRQAKELPLETTGQAERVAGFRKRRTAAEQAVRAAEAEAARAHEIDQARQDLSAAQREHDEAVSAEAKASTALEAAQRKRAAASSEARELQDELARVEPLAAKDRPLAHAEARLAELGPQIEAAEADVLRFESGLMALPAPAELPPSFDVAIARSAVGVAEDALTAAHRKVATTEQQLEQARASATRLELLAAERTVVEAEIADWTRLAADLGRDGLQAMVIDGAIPEINQLTNDLLHAAFGPRFTVDVRTQAADAKGRRMLETLDVWVIDTGTEQHAGREGHAETFSGGERTILAEALSLALTALACRQAGAERPTLIRDESAGALSAGNAPIWIAMLRRAADLIGADRILFVNHDRQTWDLADRQIWVGKGPAN